MICYFEVGIQEKTYSFRRSFGRRDGAILSNVLPGLDA